MNGSRGMRNTNYYHDHEVVVDGWHFLTSDVVAWKVRPWGPGQKLYVNICSGVEIRTTDQDEIDTFISHIIHIYKKLGIHREDSVHA